MVEELIKRYRVQADLIVNMTEDEEKSRARLTEVDNMFVDCITDLFRFGMIGNDEFVTGMRTATNMIREYRDKIETAAMLWETVNED